MEARSLPTAQPRSPLCGGHLPCFNSRLVRPRSLQPWRLQELGWAGQARQSQCLSHLQRCHRMPQEEGERGKGNLALARTQPPAGDGLAPVPLPRCCFDFVPFSQPTGNLLLDRKVCSIQGAPDPSSPLGSSAGEEAEY